MPATVVAVGRHHVLRHVLRRSWSAVLLSGVCACASSSSNRTAPVPAPAPPPAAPVAPAAPAEDGAALMKDAQDALTLGQHALARAHAERALGLPAFAVDAGLLVAQSHLQDDGDLAAAEKALAPGLAAKDVRAQSVLARIREVQGNAAEARTLLEALAALQPPLPDAHERLASLAMTEAAQAHARGDKAAARAAFNRALVHFGAARASGTDAPALAVGESRAREGLGDVAGAEAALRRLVDLMPGEPSPHLQLAAFHERHGQKERAATERRLAGEEARSGPRRLRPLQPSAR